MSVELQTALWSLVFAALGGLTLLLRLVQIKLMTMIDDATHAARRAETNSNGNLDKLIEENVRLKLELAQLYATIHNQKE